MSPALEAIDIDSLAIILIEPQDSNPPT